MGSKTTIGLDLSNIHLGKCSHDSRNRGVCAMEAAAWLAGRAHSDSPPCVSPVIRRFIIGLNDAAPDAPRQRLVEILPNILGTSSRGSDKDRSFALADWAVRVVAPLMLDASGKNEEAAKLRALPQIVDAASSRAASAAAYAADAYAADAAAAYAAAADAYAAFAAYAAAYAAYAADDAADAADDAKEDMWTRIMDSAIPLIQRISK